MPLWHSHCILVSDWDFRAQSETRRRRDNPFRARRRFFLRRPPATTAAGFATYLEVVRYPSRRGRCPVELRFATPAWAFLPVRRACRPCLVGLPDRFLSAFEPCSAARYRSQALCSYVLFAPLTYCTRTACRRRTGTSLSLFDARSRWFSQALPKRKAHRAVGICHE